MRTRWAVLMLVVVAAVCVLAAAGWSMTSSRSAEVETETARLASQIPAATEELAILRSEHADRASALESVRLESDPELAVALTTLRLRAEAFACERVNEAVRDGVAPEPLHDLVAQVTDDAELEFPILAELPGWETRFDATAVQAAIDRCRGTTEAAIREQEEARGRQLSTPIEATRVVDGRLCFDWTESDAGLECRDPEASAERSGSVPDTRARGVCDSKSCCRLNPGWKGCESR